MAIWDKVKEGIDKAGKAAQEAFDEGKTRIDAYRVREQADKAAEALGYAVFRAADVGRELDPETRDRLMRALREKDAEARRLENEIANDNKARPSTPPSDSANETTSPPDSPPPAGDTV